MLRSLLSYFLRDQQTGQTRCRKIQQNQNERGIHYKFVILCGNIQFWINFNILKEILKESSYNINGLCSGRHWGLGFSCAWALCFRFSRGDACTLPLLPDIHKQSMYKSNGFCTGWLCGLSCRCSSFVLQLQTSKWAILFFWWEPCVLITIKLKICKSALNLVLKSWFVVTIGNVNARFLSESAKISELSSLGWGQFFAVLDFNLKKNCTQPNVQHLCN